ncbi:pyrazinamidase/nicotinamidase [Helicobacter pylori]|nr:pyrazinamidase/nicotinamidase [Helicobacter pylori]
MVKDTKIDSYQFMDLNTHQNTKMQTLALPNINHKT